MRPSKKLLHAFCVQLRVLVPSVSIALAETVLSAQAVQMHNPQIAQLHKLCMLIFQKLAVGQALRVEILKISTVWERKIAQACLPLFVSLSCQCALCSVENSPGEDALLHSHTSFQLPTFFAMNCSTHYSCSVKLCPPMEGFKK